MNEKILSSLVSRLSSYSRKKMVKNESDKNLKKYIERTINGYSGTFGKD
jgi:hypothetical protein